MRWAKISFPRRRWNLVMHLKKRGQPVNFCSDSSMVSGKMKQYQRFLTSESKPFDPVELARETEKMVTREGLEGLERKYTGFYSVPVYGGIATGYAAGCCLRCIYCWSNWSRDFPEKHGEFYSPIQAAQNLFKAAERGITYSDY